MDGNVIIKAVLDTVDVSKNIKALERDLQGISWKNITRGRREGREAVVLVQEGRHGRHG